MKSHYSYEQLVNALKQLGLKAGDTVFTHSNIGVLGFPENGSTGADCFKTVFDAFFDVLKPEGTLIVPTFTYSYGRGEVFDPGSTVSQMGIFAETIRKMPDAVRSEDPMFSVAAIGAKATYLTQDISNVCFGEDSFWDRFYHLGGKICNVGVFGGASTFFHYVERKLNVPYRYDKLFSGITCVNGEEHKKDVIFFCQDMNNIDTRVNIDDFNRIGIESGSIKTTKVGRSAVCCISAKETFALIEQTIKKHPYFLTEAFKEDRSPILIEQGKHLEDNPLGKNASMSEMIVAVWDLRRDMVSDRYDDALNILSSQLPLIVHEYPTGTRVGKRLIPEKWTCKEGCLETVRGERIFSYEDSHLHVASYSQSYDGIVTQQELFKHLSIDPLIDDATPTVNLYGNRDWRLCCSNVLKKSLSESEYKVTIKSHFSYSTLKVGESLIKGDSNESILFVGYLGTFTQLDHGLSGSVAGIEVMRRLIAQKASRFSYRLLLCPDNTGLDAYLDANSYLESEAKAVIILDNLGIDRSYYTLQVSDYKNDELYNCCQTVINRSGFEGSVNIVRLLRNGSMPAFTFPLLVFSGSIGSAGTHDNENRNLAKSWSESQLSNSVETILTLLRNI